MTDKKCPGYRASNAAIQATKSGSCIECGRYYDNHTHEEGGPSQRPQWMR